MDRVKVRNPIVIKGLIIGFVVLISIGLISFCGWIIFKSMNTMTYDLGEKSNLTDYEDFVIRNYYDYLDLVEKYGIEENLTIENFANNHYIASFQEYDPCGESKMKDVENVVIDENIHVIFKINNKCGWCKKHIALHLIKIDKINENKKITYDYTFAKKLDCGTV